MTAVSPVTVTPARPGTLAALVHRISGLALAVFLPLHFLSLGLALHQESFAGFIAWTDQPLVKAGEALLVTALAVHFAGGLRVLAVELLGLTRAQGVFIAVAFAFGAGVGLLFVLKAFG